MKFYIFGSALWKKTPRDVDMAGVMDDNHFERTYDLTCKRGLSKWKNQTMGATRVLQFMFPELVPIDFSFMSESELREPNREVDLATPTKDWGIGWPLNVG